MVHPFPDNGGWTRGAGRRICSGREGPVRMSRNRELPAYTVIGIAMAGINPYFDNNIRANFRGYP